MKMTVGKQLYVCVGDEPNALWIIDELESFVNTNMSGDRQIMVSAEALSDALEENNLHAKFVPIATEILEEAQKQECGDINIYC